MRTAAFDSEMWLSPKDKKGKCGGEVSGQAAVNM
jgi:hypothetical protein